METTMARKTKTPADDARREEADFADAVRDSAQQIWLAGLGAFRKAQEEGSKAFDKLVKEGGHLQKLSRDLAESKTSDMASRFAQIQDKVTRQASDTWDKLEAVFESRVERALASLGVPTEQDVAVLHRRIEALSAEVERLKAGKTKPAAKSAAAKPGAKSAAKPAAKRPARKATSKAA
jgi:poly(hydroxyalkanoate) granule-associated protein